ncbi:hypothetical protein B0F90DRAFT_1043013 [Multifurca ochricompacta]|uniref:Transmembrane protein n=1 Tax=Multifurca ochricompacta TaxID=376703 RepID=A0AAD4M1M5_9AGAM|nr:hypothetical protein B0F90DRAFT_1043013 [Multifurca ochricompacta]
MGTSTSIPVTRTVQTVLPTVLPVSSASAKSSVPMAAIVAPTSAMVVLILALIGFLCHRRRQRVGRADLPTFDITPPPPMHEKEISPRSELPPSISVLPPVQNTGGWNDPPTAAFPSTTEQEQQPTTDDDHRDPFADPVLVPEKKSIASIQSSPIPARDRSHTIRRVPVPEPFPTCDPFVDPPALVSTTPRMVMSQAGLAKRARTTTMRLMRVFR